MTTRHSGLKQSSHSGPIGGATHQQHQPTHRGPAVLQVLILGRKLTPQRWLSLGLGTTGLDLLHERQYGGGID